MVGWWDDLAGWVRLRNQGDHPWLGLGKPIGPILRSGARGEGPSRYVDPGQRPHSATGLYRNLRERFSAPTPPHGASVRLTPDPYFGVFAVCFSTADLSWAFRRTLLAANMGPMKRLGRLVPIG